MNHRTLNRVGSALGIGGIAICAASTLGRAGGIYYVLGYEVGTIFGAGVALIAVACLVKLEVLVSRGGG